MPARQGQSKVFLHGTHAGGTVDMDTSRANAGLNAVLGGGGVAQVVAVDRLRVEQSTKHFLICIDETKGVPAGTAGRLERFMQRLTLSVAVLPSEFTRLVPVVFTVVGTCHTTDRIIDRLMLRGRSGAVGSALLPWRGRESSVLGVSLTQNR